MKKQTIKKIIIFLLIFVIGCCFIKTYTYADFDPNFYNPSSTQDNTRTLLESKFSNVTSLLSTIGSYVSIIALILLGIKYMTASVEEKAEYKETLTPYIIGATMVFAISSIVNLIVDLTMDLSNSTGLDQFNGKIISILSTIGSILSVIMLVIIGIKYMSSAVEEKAEYKKTLMPYVIGAIFVFAASQLAGLVYSLAIQI